MKFFIGSFGVAFFLTFLFLMANSHLSFAKTEMINPLIEIIPIPSASPTPTPTPSPTPTPTPKSTPSPTPKPTPTPQPSPTIKPYTAQDMDNWFRTYASKFNVTEDLLKKIAICESYLNPRARNGDYLGLYQFASSTWRSARAQMSENSDPGLRADPEESIETAAYYISKHGSGAWPNCD